MNAHTAQLFVVFLAFVLTWAAEIPKLAGAVPTLEQAVSHAGALDVAQIDAFIGQQVRRHGIPGLALGVVQGDRVVHLSGFGKADESGRALTPQTPFILASVSKPLTAMAVMQLVETGAVELDAPVQRYVPDFRLADPTASAQITVRHLLLHTSGIPSTECDTRREAETLEQYVAELRTVTPVAQPGVRHVYCSGNYNVLGRVIELVSGQPFAAYVKQRVFAPLQMGNSFASEEEARRAGLAQNYRWLFGALVPYHERYNTSQLPSGYLISSAEDLSHFLVAQLNGGRYGATSILSAESVAAMQGRGVATGPGAGAGAYGLGLVSAPIGGVPVLQHGGVHADVRTLVFLEPETGRGAVLLMNSFSFLASVGAFKEVEEGVVRLVAGQEPAAPSSVSLPALYVIVDAVLGALLVLSLWPLLRMRRWHARLRRDATSGRIGRMQLLRLGLRLAWELAVPIALLAGARLALHAAGAQSWAEGFAVFPDLGAWLWVVSLLLLVTGALRLALSVRTLRGVRTPD